MNPMHNSPGKQSGLSMIEVLVSLHILMVGLLGLAGLQTQGLRSEMESYQRVQALNLLQDMAGRISANRGNNSLPTNCTALTTLTVPTRFSCEWDNIRANVNAYVANDIGVTDVQPVDCTTLAVGKLRDTCDWSYALKGAAETSVTGRVGAMIGGRGCVTLVSSDATQISVQVHVAWQGMGKSFSQATNLCGKDLYGGDDDTQRRVVSLTMRIANLSAI